MHNEQQHISGIDFKALIANNPMLVAGGVALAGWGIYEMTKKNRVGKIDNNTLLLAGAGIVAVYLFSRQASTPVTSIPVYSPTPVTTGPNVWSTISTIGPGLIKDIFDLF